MIHYTSDLHFGHLKLAEFRGFDTVDAHDWAVIENWNDRVRKDDAVFVLGDVCLSAGNLAKVSLLNGTKHLITGNHDGVHPMHRESHKKQGQWLQYFASVRPYARRVILKGQVEFLMSHHPYEGDHTPEDRDVQFRLRDMGVDILHGHVHTDQRLTHTSIGTKQLHVGLDAWDLAPITEDTVVELLRD